MVYSRTVKEAASNLGISERTFHRLVGSPKLNKDGSVNKRDLHWREMLVAWHMTGFHGKTGIRMAKTQALLRRAKALGVTTDEVASLTLTGFSLEEIVKEAEAQAKEEQSCSAAARSSSRQTISNPSGSGSSGPKSRRS